MKYKLLALALSVLFFSNIFAQQVQSGPTLDDQYRKKSGNLRLSKTTLSFGKIRNNEVRSDTIYLYNAGKSDMSLAVSTKLPAFLKVSTSASMLKPDEKGYLVVTYDASKKNDFGMVFDRFFINTNDTELPSKNINVTANIQEYFPPAVDGDSTVVKANIPETVFDFGILRQGDKSGKSFTISNNGTKKLIVRTIKNSCGCIKTTLSKNEILPGESAILKVEFDSFGKSGKLSKFITVYLNDPLMPEVKIEVKGEVTK